MAVLYCSVLVSNSPSAVNTGALYGLEPMASLSPPAITMGSNVEASSKAALDCHRAKTRLCLAHRPVEVAGDMGAELAYVVLSAVNETRFPAT